jgi:hypothetical protein
MLVTRLLVRNYTIKQIMEFKPLVQKCKIPEVKKCNIPEIKITLEKLLSQLSQLPQLPCSNCSNIRK